MIRRALPIAILLSAVAAPGGAQTLVAPTIMTMSDRDRFGTFMVDNRSEEPQEVTISFKFGYSTSDETGRRTFVYDDSVSAAALGLHGRIRAFPRRFVLAPGARQIVRMSARPPVDAPDGVYWARVVTASQPQSAAVEQQVAEGVTTRVVFRLEQVTTVLYQKGEVATGLEPGPLKAQMERDSVTVTLPLRRTGNAPFFGRARLLVIPDVTEAGLEPSPEREDELLFEVFFDRVIRFDVPLEGLPSGHYRVRIVLSPDRPDVPPQDRVLIDPLEIEAPFSVP